jgi:hypothetical protein
VLPCCAAMLCCGSWLVDEACDDLNYGCGDFCGDF